MSSSPEPRKPDDEREGPRTGRKGRPGKALWILAGAAALIGLYAALGFWVAPRIIRQQVTAQIAQRYHRTASLGEVRLNPFTLKLQADRFNLPDADGRPMIGFARLTVGIAPASIWRGGLVFSEINLEAPNVRLVRRADGRLNLQDLIPPPSKKPSSGGPPKIMIDHLSVHGGDATIADLDRPSPFIETFNPVNFTLNDFSTVKDGAGYALKAVTERGERLAWRGDLGLSPLESDGRFAVAGVKAAPLSALAGDALPFGITSGEIDLSGRYHFALRGRRLALAVDIGDLRITDAGLRARGAAADWISLPGVAASAIHIDIPAQSVSVGRIEASDPSVTAWTEKGGGLNLARYAGPKKPPAAPSSSGRAWTINLPDLRLAGGKIAFEDRSVATPVTLTVTPIDVAVTGLALPLAKPVQVDVSAGLEGGGRLSAKGAVTLDQLSADLNVEVSDIGLPRLQPYIDRAANLTLLSGRLSGKGHATYAAARGGGFDGALRIDDLHTVDKDLRQDFVNWRSLRFDGVRARSQPLSLKVDEVAAEAPYARVVIGPNYVMNIQTVLSGKAAAKASPRVADGADLQPAAASDASIASQPATPDAASASASASAPAPSATPPVDRKALPIEINRVRIENGRMDFADLSITPHFAAGIENLKGTIKGLSGRQDARADVDLTGQVDRYAPVTIGGQINYFAARSFTDVRMNFQNMELTTFSPYSGKFAGYRIDKGKLNVDLHYNIDDQKLHATHHVVINQLQLGDKVDSASAVKLPVKLIIALLKDRNGVIDIPIEIDGTLDDPKFRIWPLIWKIVDNLLVKIVTSPFALLGHLVGGGEELSYIDFAPGGTALDDPGRQKLVTLAKALVERPAINLDIPMTVDPLLDRPALVEARLKAELTAAAAEQLGKRGAQPAAVDAALSIPRTRRKVLEALYRRQFGAKPELPKPQAPANGAKPDADQAAVAWLEDKLRARITVTDLDLQQLGRVRAQAVQDALLSSGQVSPSRVFVITEPPKDAPQVRMTLSLS